MEDNKFPIPSSDGQNPKSVGTGEGEVPMQSIPIQNVTMQTMKSDIESMKKNGGSSPTPYTPQQTSNQQSSSGGVFVPPQPNPQTPNQPPTPPTDQSQGNVFPPENQKKSKNGFLVGIISFLIVVALGFLGYFFVYPYFEEQQAPNKTTTDTTQTPKTVPVVETPKVTTTTEVLQKETSTTPVSTSTATSTQESKVKDIIHKSLFKTPADVVSEISLSSFTISAYSSSIKNSTADVPLFKEIVFRNNGKVVAFNKVSEFLAPQTFSKDIVSSFNQDATFFTYTDSDGTWPGVVVSLKPDVKIDEVKAAIKPIETNGEFRNFFLSDPGIAKGWNDGKIETYSGRYNMFSTKGSSLNYFWANNNLVISTSYSGAKEAAKHL